MIPIVDMKFVELHSPLFHSGTNLGSKLEPAKRQSLALQFDSKKELLYVWLNHHVSVLPLSSVHSMTPYLSEDMGIEEPPARLSLAAMQQGFTPKKAQVSTPQSHVFEGPGQTGQAKVK